MIPKIIHYVWVGPNRLPEVMEKNISGWMRHHPEFELKRWNEDNIDFSIPYLQTAKQCHKWSNISNLVRLIALRQYGGIYLDTDVEVLRSFAPLLSNNCFLGFQLRTRSVEWVNNAVFGATPNHPFILKLENQLLSAFDGREQANLSSPRLTTAVLLDDYDLNRYRRGDEHDVLLRDVRIFPTRYFYPYSPLENFTESCITPDTYTIHHWANSWISGEEQAREGSCL